MFPNPLRRQMPIAAVASASTSRVNENPRSCASDRVPSPLEAPRHMPDNSASPDESATTPCVVDHALMVHSPSMATPALVDFRVLRHPAQFASVYVSTVRDGPCNLKVHTSLGYLSVFLLYVGFCMLVVLKSFTSVVAFVTQNIDEDEVNGTR